MRISQQPRLVAVVPLIVLALLLGVPAFAAAQFVQSDLGDTWHVRGLHTDNGGSSNPAQWISGTLTLSATGIVQSGSVTLSDATVETITAGRLTLAASGLVSGTLTVGGVLRTVRATMTSD